MGRVPLAARVGTTLRDKWTLSRLIGEGGMAAVFEGVHRIGRRDAIKILREGRAQTRRCADAGRRARLGRAAARGPRRRSRGWPRPSGHQARQPASSSGWQAEGARLRHRPTPGVVAHGDGHRHGYGGLHASGAGARGGGRRARRPVRRRRHDLPTAVRSSHSRGGQRGRARLQDGHAAGTQLGLGRSRAVAGALPRSFHGRRRRRRRRRSSRSPTRHRPFVCVVRRLAAGSCSC